MHDAIEVERRGKPAVAICTDLFQAGAAAVAQMRGMPAFPVALVRHPLGVLGPEELLERARDAVPQVHKILTGT